MARRINVMVALGILLLGGTLSGCASIIGAAGGVSVLATPRGHTMLAGNANAHVAVGKWAASTDQSALLWGTEANFRATNDYGHLGFGITGSFVHAGPNVSGYVRGGFAPVSGSVRNGLLLYSANVGIEGGLIIVNPDPNRPPLVGTGFLITLRSDLDYQPAIGSADLFFSLNFGYAGYSFMGIR